ncbi:hypothetical protein CL633_01485 [bacterium]|nr:hypothetical protein [bacterium]|tara:strand:+ start:1908 stop:2165 length:258 start_codon:yes stop_codon:yes gene_type:complete
MIKYTDAHIRNLIGAYLSPTHRENAQDLADSCHYSVIENYMPDCPGWCGDILTVIYGFAECYEVFLIKDNNLVKIDSEIEIVKNL